MGSLRAALLGVMVAVAMTGCLLTTSFDGIVGTRTTTEGGASDALDERVANPDGSVVADASDGGADVASGSFCSKQVHTFCADFDTNPDPTAGWTSLSNNGPGVLNLDGQTFVSGPGAARFDVPSNCTTLDKESIGSGTPKKAHYAVDFQIGAAPANFTSIVSFSPLKNASYFLILAADRTLFFTDSTASDGGYVSTAVGAVPSNTWVHITMDITFGGAVLVRIHPPTGPDLVHSSTTSFGAASNAPSLQTGACTVGTSGATLYFDNVTMDLEY